VEKNISDTAYWVAAYRAAETDRSDAIFQDPLARVLAGHRGEKMIQKMASEKLVESAVIVRTAVLDDFVMDVVHKNKADAILNLGAGLDTRPYRLDLPRDLTWIEVDFPNVISYKSSKLQKEKPKCLLERVRLDLSNEKERQTFFKGINERFKRVCVLTEGLIIYLTPDDVESLAKDMYKQTHFRWWAFDHVSGLMVKYLNLKWRNALREHRAPFQFITGEGANFFPKRGWKVKEFRSYLEEAHRFNRELPWAWFLWLIENVIPGALSRKFRLMRGFILLERWHPKSH